jgi:hypothetical protein
MVNEKKKDVSLRGSTLNFSAIAQFKEQLKNVKHFG